MAKTISTPCNLLVVVICADGWARARTVDGETKLKPELLHSAEAKKEVIQ